MSAPITIRCAAPAEAEAVLRLTWEAFAAYRDLLDPPSSVFRETTATVEQAMAAGAIYVAVHEGAMVGVREDAMIGAVRVYPAEQEHALYCGRLAVLPAARGLGIGTALMRRVEQQAAEEGYPAVVLGVRLQLPDNRRFFERLGYHATGEATHAGRATPTFAWLRKDLPPRPAL